MSLICQVTNIPYIAPQHHRQILWLVDDDASLHVSLFSPPPVPLPVVNSNSPVTDFQISEINEVGTVCCMPPSSRSCFNRTPAQGLEATLPPHPL